MEILVNQILGDRYQIQSILGRQTDRRTFLARDLQTERSVVLKLLLFESDFTWDDLKRFDREAEVLKSLDFPTIPQYLDYFDADTELGTGFVLVQTYIEARSLQNWLDAGRTFSEEELISIATQLLTIFDHLHNHQPAVIHRDIKPSNILLGDRSGNNPGQVYLVDFGLLKTATNGSSITGYMPPEQFDEHTIITPASDLYALGATIICLATGKQPSELPSRDRIDFVDPPSKRLHQPINLSPHMARWLQSMIAASIDSRPKSASQALLALSTQNQNRENTLKFDSRNVGYKIRVWNTSQVLDISLPPRGFHSSIIFAIGFAIMWNLNVLSILFSMLRSGTFSWMMLLFMIPFLAFGLWTILIIFAPFVTRRLRIDESKISLSLEIFGLSFTSQMAARQHIDRVEITPLSYKKDSDGDLMPIPPHLNIWAGKKKFSLIDFNLTESEQEALAYDLIQWLNLSPPC